MPLVKDIRGRVPRTEAEIAAGRSVVVESDREDGGASKPQTANASEAKLELLATGTAAPLGWRMNLLVCIVQNSKTKSLAWGGLTFAPDGSPAACSSTPLCTPSPPVHLRLRDGSRQCVPVVLAVCTG